MPKTEHVFLILIDGLRPDALFQSYSPTIDRMARQGDYTLAAQTVSPSVTLPCHTSLFFSTTPQRHGVVTNVWKPFPSPYPGLIDVVGESGRGAMLCCSWEELRDLSHPGSLDFACFMRYRDPYGARTELELAAAAADYFVNARPAFGFLYLELPDLVGHDHGWMSAEYLDALQRSDDAIQSLWQRLEEAGLSESTTLVITADHGGHGFNHGDLDETGNPYPEDMTIPLVFYGAGIIPGIKIDHARIIDIAPTIAALLGLPAPRQWEGQPILDGMVSR